MRFFTTVTGVLKQLSLFVIYILSHLVPRNKKVWLYGNYKGTFRDNAKYLYLYGNKNFSEITHVWITPDKDVVQRLQQLGFNACYKYSLKALLYALTAKVYIYNITATTDIYNSSFQGSAFLFNLWHGVPYKKIEYDVNAGPLQPYFNPKSFSERITSFIREPKTFRKSSAVLATTEKLRGIFSGAFELPKDKVFVGPYPRNTIFNWNETELVNYIEKFETLELRQAFNEFKRFDKVIIYMPTWRDANPTFMDDAIPSFDRLEEVCKTHHILFVIKSHILAHFSVDLANYNHITNLHSSIDVYPLLPFTHALISDYSSVIFDYSLLKKKIIFYAFDKEEYLSKSREAYFKYEEVFTENYTNTFFELLEEINVFGWSNTNATSTFSYPLSESFLDTNTTNKDIFDYIRKSINY